MRGTIEQSDVYHNHDTANKLAEQNNSMDDGWSYTVVVISDKWARVLIQDEDGQEVGYL